MNSKPALFDLHLHTWWSFDATNNPEHYFRCASRLGMRCIAITDHHHIDSREEVDRLAACYPQVRVIRAAELSVKTSFGSFDLLCYRLPDQPAGALAEVLEYYRRYPFEHGMALCRGMTALGYPYGEADLLELLKSYRPAHVIARQGITMPANAKKIQDFAQRGWVADRAAFGRLVEEHPEVFQFPSYLPVEQVVPAVRAAGGVVVLAHPFRYLGSDLKKMEAVCEECQLDGLECAHPAVPPEMTVFYREFCRRRGLISTAGSDSHYPEVFEPPEEGWGYSARPVFGAHLGEAAWLDEFLERVQ